MIQKLIWNFPYLVGSSSWYPLSPFTWSWSWVRSQALLYKNVKVAIKCMILVTWRNFGAAAAQSTSNRTLQPQKITIYTINTCQNPPNNVIVRRRKKMFVFHVTFWKISRSVSWKKNFVHKKSLVMTKWIVSVDVDLWNSVDLWNCNFTVVFIIDLHVMLQSEYHLAVQK